jgi:hypothetical protein
MSHDSDCRNIIHLAMRCAIAVLFAITLPCTSNAQAKKPNILVIMGDDIGWYNPSIYNRGDMAYQIKLRTLTALVRRARYSSAGMRSRVVPPGVLLSSPGNHLFAPALRKWVLPGRMWD